MNTTVYDNFENLDSFYQDPSHLSHKKMRLVLKSVRPGGSLIDVGCGTGEFIIQLRDHFKTLTGTDISLRAIEFTARKVGKDEKVSLYQGELESLRFPNEQFNVCLCLDVLEHVPNLFPLVREIYRLLHPKGELIITVPNWYDIIVTKILKRNPFHVNAKTPWQWMAIFRKVGFKIRFYRAVEFPVVKSDFLARRVPILGMCILIVAVK